MSAKLMGQVWGVAVPRCEREVLLALADHSDDHGRGARPSVGYLSWKTDFSERQVQRAIYDLKAKGIVEVGAYATGGRGHAPEYRLHLDRAPKKRPWEEIREERRATRRKGDIASPFDDAMPNTMGDTTSPIAEEKGDTMSPIGAERVTSATRMGDISDPERVTFGAVMGDIAMSPEPLEPSVNEPPENHNGGILPVAGTPGVTAPPPDAAALTPAQLDEGKRVRSGLATWLGLDLHTLSGKPLERLNVESKALARADITAEDLTACRERWFREHWAGSNRDKSDRDRRPSLDQAIEWVSWCRGQGARSDGAAIQAAITNGHVLADGALSYADQEMAAAERQAAVDGSNLADVWTQVLASLRLQTLRSTFDHWYARTQLQAITDDGLAIVVAHSRHATAWLTDRDGGVVARHLAEMGMDVHQVMFIDVDEYAAAAPGRAA